MREHLPPKFPKTATRYTLRRLFPYRFTALSRVIHRSFTALSLLYNDEKTDF